MSAWVCLLRASQHSSSLIHLLNVNLCPRPHPHFLWEPKSLAAALLPPSIVHSHVCVCVKGREKQRVVKDKKLKN